MLLPFIPVTSRGPVTSAGPPFLSSPQDLLPPSLPIISVSKGIEVTSGQLMSEVIPSVLSKKHPTVYLSGGWRWPLRAVKSLALPLPYLRCASHPI